MMQFLADQIDQMDLALDQLAMQDRNFDRFALMLIDNVVELTLHNYAIDRSYENDMWGRFSEPRNDPKLVAAALGQRFDSKIKLARAKKNLIRFNLRHHPISTFFSKYGIPQRSSP